jgi:flagellar motility protein MotE (MotC chaperone)
VKFLSLLINVHIEERCMLELSKSAKLRMLILGVMLVKLALLLFFYHPVFGLSSLPSSPLQDTTSPVRARAQRPDVGGSTAGSTETPGRKVPGTALPLLSQPTAAGQQQTEGAFTETALQGDQTGESPWESVKQLAAALERQRAMLVSKEARLRQEEERLEALKVSLHDQLEELTAMNAQVSEAARKKADLEEEELKRVVRIYEATSPEQSGVLLGKLDAKLAARILSRMNGAKAGKVLTSMEPTQAARLSEQLAKKE